MEKDDYNNIEESPLENQDENRMPYQRKDIMLYLSSKCEIVKLVAASSVVSILVLVVCAGVALGYSVLKIYPLANFVMLLSALILLAYVEALHYAVVAVEKWDMSKYAEEFPRALKCHNLVNTPTKVKKFLVGRQFFVIFVVFLIAQITSFPDIPANFAGLPADLILVLLQTGLPGIALVLTFGQLVSQLFVEEFTIQFLNYYGCEFCIRLSLGAEYIGICNFSWFLFYASSYCFCQSVKRAKRIMRLVPPIHFDNSDPKSYDTTMNESIVTNDSFATSDIVQSLTDESQSAVLTENFPDENKGTLAFPDFVDFDLEAMSPTIANRGPGYDTGLHHRKTLSRFDYLKYLWSTAATCGSVAIILYGISIESYVLPVGVPGAYIIALLMMINLFYLEGLMIAIVATQYWDPETFCDAYPRAYRIHKLVNQPENVKCFIIGRQFCTVLTNFMLAQIFTFAHFENPGWPDILFYIVVKSGLVGVLTVLAFSQLMPELLAAEYPLRFMNLPYSFTVTYVSLAFNYLGVGHCAWAVYFVFRKMLCGRYLEQRAAARRASFGTHPRSSDAFGIVANSEKGQKRHRSSHAIDKTLPEPDCTPYTFKYNNANSPEIFAYILELESQESLSRKKACTNEPRDAENDLNTNLSLTPPTSMITLVLPAPLLDELNKVELTIHSFYSIDYSNSLSHDSQVEESVAMELQKESPPKTKHAEIDRTNPPIKSSIPSDIAKNQFSDDGLGDTDPLNGAIEDHVMSLGFKESNYTED